MALRAFSRTIESDGWELAPSDSPAELAPSGLGGVLGALCLEQ